MSALDALEGVDAERLTDAARDAIWGAWRQRSGRRAQMSMIGEYAAGRGGIPEVEEGAHQELKDLAKLSRLGMCRTVMRTFLRGLSVSGFRSPAAQDDEPVWAWWQAHRMDARQAIVHRQALTYGTAYVSLLPDDRTEDPARPAFWSPLSAIVKYEQPDDPFPARAVLMRHTRAGTSVLLVDDMTVTPALLRNRAAAEPTDGNVDGFRRGDIRITGEPWAHGAVYDEKPVCPIVRFLDEASDDERDGTGVVEPIIDLNRAMNQVNFDRLVVARFGAYDQKLIIGWTDSKTRLVELSSSRIGAIPAHPEDVRIDSWKASPLSPYSELIKEMREQMALEAAIPLWAAGSISNVSTDTAAMIEAAHQRELRIKRNGYGESWEQLLRLAAVMNDHPQPDDAAEMVWLQTQVQAFGTVVDGIQKLASIPADAGGVPVDQLLDMIPGMSQQRIDAIAEIMARRRADAMLTGLLGGFPQLPPAPPEPASALGS